VQWHFQGTGWALLKVAAEELSFTSNSEGAWTTRPTEWTDQYFGKLLGFDWVVHKVRVVDVTVLALKHWLFVSVSVRLLARTS
jgi:catalase (peroxidase I)